MELSKQRKRTFNLNIISKLTKTNETLKFIILEISKVLKTTLNKSNLINSEIMLNILTRIMVIKILNIFPFYIKSYISYKHQLYQIQIKTILQNFTLNIQSILRVFINNNQYIKISKNYSL